MPPTTVSALNILLFLLPGLISFSVERAMFYRPDDTTFDKTVSALIHTFIVNAIYAGLTYLTPLDFAIYQTKISGESVSLMVSNPLSLLCLFCIAVGWGLFFGWLKDRDYLLYLPRILTLSTSTSRPSVWFNVFKDINCYVLVVLKDGRGISGWPQYYENRFSDDPVLFVTKAYWVVEGKEPEVISNPGILIKGSEIAFVQFFTEKEQSDVLTKQ